MNYFITKQGNIIDENNQFIPQEEGNPLYDQYLEYLEDNGTVEPTDFVLDFEVRQANTPVEVPLWRIRAILALLEKEQLIHDAIEQLPEPTQTGARYAWNYGTIIERNSQTVLFIQQALEMTSVEVDDIFIQAQSISI